MSEPDSNDELTAAVEHYIDDMGWSDPDLPVVDVLLVVQRRGFDRAGGKSVVSNIVPTDSAVPTLLGMCHYARIRLEKMVQESLDGET